MVSLVAYGHVCLWITCTYICMTFSLFYECLQIWSSAGDSDSSSHSHTAPCISLLLDNDSITLLSLLPSQKRTWSTRTQAQGRGTEIANANDFRLSRALSEISPYEKKRFFFSQTRLNQSWSCVITTINRLRRLNDAHILYTYIYLVSLTLVETYLDESLYLLAMTSVNAIVGRPAISASRCLIFSACTIKYILAR